MIYREPDFLARRMIWLLPHPLPPSPDSKLVFLLSQSSCMSPVDGGGGGRAGYEPKHTTARKPWSSIKHSILSGVRCCNYDYLCCICVRCGGGCINKLAGKHKRITGAVGVTVRQAGRTAAQGSNSYRARLISSK
jgi:hypothetical protein